MDFIDRFTEGARRALALSQDSAKEMGHNYVGSEHLLLGLIKEGEGAAARALAQLGIREADVSARADELVGHGDYHFTDSFGYTPRTKKILELSLYEAKSLKNSYIGTEHILLAIKREKDCVAAVSDACGNHEEAGKRKSSGGGGRHPGIEQVRPRPYQTGEKRRARPGDRP